ncbi:MAG: outer membrane beta-barrel protein [Pseudomonadota bacterium]
MAGACFVSAPAFAAPATVNSIQIGLGARYGIEMMEGEGNPWGFGLGVNGGITLPMAVYVGGVAEYFFGEEVDVPGGSFSTNLWQLMAEGGYDLGAGPLVVRPKVGLGFVSSSGEACVTGFGCTDVSSTDFALAPGVAVMAFLPMLSVSADVRYELVFAEETGKGLLFSLGLGF